MLCNHHHRYTLMVGLTTAQQQAFAEQGYLVIENVLEQTVLDAVYSEYNVLLNHVADKLYSTGRIPSRYKDLSFDQRYAKLIHAAPEIYYQYLDISLPISNDIPEYANAQTGPAVFNLLSHKGVLDIVESIIGPEIYSNPIQHTRIKPPERLLPVDMQIDSNMARTLWHQDEAVALASAAHVNMLTVWLSITNATLEQGCMMAVPGSHQFSDLAIHCPGKIHVGEIYITEELIAEQPVVPLEVYAGGVVLLHKRTWHGAKRNISDRLRWSFDLRYQPAGFPTGRDFFPGFLARSQAHPEQVLSNPEQWAASWQQAKAAIRSGQIKAVFNERWNAYSQHTLCA